MATSKAKLLSMQARKKCQEIAQLKAGLASKRALALLAVDQGEVQGEAAKNAGLTIGQVRYAIALFRKKKLALFPDDLLNKKVLTIAKAAKKKVNKINLKEIETVAKKSKKEEDKKAKEKAKKVAAIKAKAKKKAKAVETKKKKKVVKAAKKAKKSSKKKETVKKSKKK